MNILFPALLMVLCKTYSKYKCKLANQKIISFQNQSTIYFTFIADLFLSINKIF